MNKISYIELKDESNLLKSEEHDISYIRKQPIIVKGNTKDFVKKYEKYYFGEYGEEKNNILNIRNITCRKIENSIVDILKKEQWEQNDVFRILAWKTGSINHKKSQAEHRFVYKKGWDEKNNTMKFHQYDISSDEFASLANSVIKLKEDYNNSIDAKAVWLKLLEITKDIKGIGTVYLITILFFVTYGEYPIYDRFAMSSLLVLLSSKRGIDTPMGTQIILEKMPGKDSLKAKELLENSVYTRYIYLLKHFFKDEWKTNRAIDRALWVYGHYFN